MSSLTVQGIVLKRKNFGEADRVLTVLTQELGKISVIARGVRKITSRRAGNIELLNKVNLHLFKGKNYTLVEAESLKNYPKVKMDLIKSAWAFHIIELVDRFIPENHNIKLVYPLLTASLELLEQNPRQIFIRAFEAKLLNLAGFWSKEAIPDIDPKLNAFLDRLVKLSWKEIDQLYISKEKISTSEGILKSYIEKILEGNLKSIQVLGKLKIN